MYHCVIVKCQTVHPQSMLTDLCSSEITFRGMMEKQTQTFVRLLSDLKLENLQHDPECLHVNSSWNTQNRKQTLGDTVIFIIYIDVIGLFL